MQWLLGFWHGKAWENWMGAWWKAGSTGKQRKGWLFWVWRKRLHQAELHWRCLVGRCPTVFFFVVSYLCTNEICQKEQQAMSASPLLFAFPLRLPRLPSTKKMLGPCCASGSPGVMGQPPTSKNKSGTWNVKVRKNWDRNASMFYWLFQLLPINPLAYFVPQHVMLQEKGKIMVRIQTQMGTFMSHDSWTEG